MTILFRAAVAVAIAVAFVLGGCAVGYMSPPQTKEIAATASAYDANFSAVVRAFNTSGGSITASDKTEGYVNGTTGMNIKIAVTLSKAGGLRATATLPGDKFLMGTSIEAELDKFLVTLRPLLK